MITEVDRQHLKRCIALAEQALAAGDDPFGSVLVGADGSALHEERNRITTENDATYHPEIELARWAARNLTPGECAAATVYTSGEHCPMCSAAHGWAGLGRIVYASSATQLAAWSQELGVASSVVRMYSIPEIIEGSQVEGPVDDLAAQVRELHVRKQRQARSM